MCERESYAQVDAEEIEVSLDAVSCEARDRVMVVFQEQRLKNSLF